MKCEHCGYEAPERAVICPECGEILPRPKKPAAEEQAKKEPSPRGREIFHALSLCTGRSGKS